MGNIIVINKTQKPVVIQARLVADAAGNTYSSSIEYAIPADGRKVIPSGVFTDLIIRELKPLQIHIKIDGVTRKILHTDDFDDDKCINLHTETDGALAVRFARGEKKERSLSYWFRCLFNLSTTPFPFFFIYLEVFYLNLIENSEGGFQIW